MCPVGEGGGDEGVVVSCAPRQVTCMMCARRCINMLYIMFDWWHKLPCNFTQPPCCRIPFLHSLSLSVCASMHPSVRVKACFRRFIITPSHAPPCPPPQGTCPPRCAESCNPQCASRHVAGNS